MRLFDPHTQIDLILESFRGINADQINWMKEDQTKLNEWGSKQWMDEDQQNWWGWINEWGSLELNKRADQMNPFNSFNLQAFNLFDQINCSNQLFNLFGWMNERGSLELNKCRSWKWIIIK